MLPMLPPISPFKKTVCNSPEIKSKNKRPFPAMQRLQTNVENYASKKLKFDGTDPYDTPNSNANFFQEKKFENEFSNENLNSHEIFNLYDQSIGQSGHLSQLELKSNDDIGSWMDGTSGSFFSNRPQLPQVQEMSGYEKLYSTDNSKIENIIYGIKTTLLCMGKGSVMKAYDITADHQLWSGIENSNILVKLYKLVRLKGKVSPRSQIKDALDMMDTAIKSYKKAEKLSIPQAIIYNVDTATKDCFLLVEKIHGELDLANIDQMEQVKNLFKIYFEKQIVLDLAPANLRVKTNESTKSKTVVIVDYMEKNKDHKRGSFFNEVLQRWYKAVFKKGSDISDDKRKSNAITLIKDLTEGLEVYGFDPQSIEKLQ